MKLNGSYADQVFFSGDPESQPDDFVRSVRLLLSPALLREYEAASPEDKTRIVVDKVLLSLNRMAPTGCKFDKCKGQWGFFPGNIQDECKALLDSAPSLGDS